jgi:hypothetical protein
VHSFRLAELAKNNGTAHERREMIASPPAMGFYNMRLLSDTTTTPQRCDLLRILQPF